MDNANQNYDQYVAFKEKQLELAGLLDESSDVIAGLNMNNYRDNLKRLGDKVHNETFKIQIVGTFSNGKSTVINSLLGEEVLPAYALPTTAVINEIKYGDEKRAVLHFKNPMPEKLPAEISEKAMRHMQKFKNQQIPPLEIPYDEIEDYVVIPLGKDAKEWELESPYEKVELFWPLPLLENHVEIIDSPGLNEAETRTKVTLDYLSKADAILLVLNAEALCAKDEMEFIENNLKLQGFEDPFFIVNRFDLIREREKQRIKDYAKLKLKDYSSNEIYFISALNALEGKIENDSDKVDGSGLPEFEKALSDFLTKQKGKAKLAQPAKELKRILNEEALFKIIPRQREMLGSSLDEVKRRYKNVKPRVLDLQTKKDQLSHKFELKIEQSKPEFKRAVIQNMAQLADSVPVWIEGFEPETKLGALPNRAKSDAAVSEIAEFITKKIEKEQLEWKKNVLQPLIQEKSESIFESAEHDISNLFSEIDDINVEVSGKVYEGKDVPTWQRVVGVTGGVLFGDLGLAISGGINGLSKDLAKTAAFEFGAGMALGILGLANPITLLGVVGVAVFMNLKKGGSNALKNVKDSVCQEVIKQLSDDAERQANELANGIQEKFCKISAQIIRAVEIEIDETNNQVRSIIQELEKGRQSVDEREEVLKRSETKIKELSTKLDALIFKLVEE